MQTIRLSIVLGQPLSIIRQMPLDDWNEYLLFRYIEPYGYSVGDENFARLRQLIFNSNVKRSKQITDTSKFRRDPFREFMASIKKSEERAEKQREREELNKTEEGRKSLVKRAASSIMAMLGRVKVDDSAKELIGLDKDK